MSFLDLHMTNSPLIINPNVDSEPVVVIFGVPFDSTHSYKPGCRFGPDAIRDAFNNIEIFQPEFGVDLEAVNINDIGNTKHTVVATEMLQMVENITTELRKQNKRLLEVAKLLREKRLKIIKTHKSRALMKEERTVKFLDRRDMDYYVIQRIILRYNLHAKRILENVSKGIFPGN